MFIKMTAMLTCSTSDCFPPSGWFRPSDKVGARSSRLWDKGGGGGWVGLFWSKNKRGASLSPWSGTNRKCSIQKIKPAKWKAWRFCTYQRSFLIRTSRIWNCLVDELDLSSSTLASFKSVIFNYYKSALAVSYDCEDPRSFKSICLKCNSARPLSRPITCCM